MFGVAVWMPLPLVIIRFLIGMGFLDATHFIVCKNKRTLRYLTQQYPLIGFMSKYNHPMIKTTAITARDFLIRSGFKWGIDFYLRVKGRD